MDRKTLLMAIDGSEHSNVVLDKTIEFAHLLGASVVLVYCHEKFPVILGEPLRDKEIARIIREAEATVQPFMERLESEKIPVEERLLEEPAGKMIANVAEIEKCDLIIMGSRGLSNLTHLIVGSVTNRVLQTAHCSVLVVR